MANLVLTNLDTGQQTVITDTLTLDQAIAGVKSVCNTYTDSSSSNVLIEAKTYADGAMLSAINNILPTISVSNYPQNSGAVRLIVGKNDDGTLKFFDIRSEKYIQAGDLLALQNAKAFTLTEITKAKTVITTQITNETSKTETNCNVYTDQKSAELAKQIQDISVVGFTFDAFANYWARYDALLDEEYDTVDLEYYKSMGWING